MAESEKDSNSSPPQESKKKIKASTGAWWKSTVVTVEETESEREGKESKQSASTDPKQPSSKQSPARPRKRGGKPSGKKSSPPKKQSVVPADTEQQVASAQDADQKEATSEDLAPAGSDTQEREPDKQKQQRKPRKPRQPRGKRSGQKPKGESKSSEGQAEKDTAESQPEIDETQSPDKKPSKRGKKHPDTKKEEKLPIEDGAEPVVKLLVNAEEPEECRLALLEDGRLESIHVTTVSRIQTKNNIYKARVVAIEPNLQAAFVDYGTEKNGFLPFSEIHPEYYRQELSPEVRKQVESHQWKKINITDVMEKGQELLVQVVKEEVGKKGANMTTYLSLPGRCVVLMPGSDSEGISRRISGEERRNQLREVMNTLKIPEGIGWIVRTASVDITKTALSKDVRFLLKLWREIKAKGQHLEGVGLLYQDYNCVMRFLREYFDPSTQEILVDNDEALEKVRDFVDMLPAKQRKVRVKQHRGARPIFNQYSVEDQIESIYQPRVNLPSGGSIVIDPTEALVAIDVNSGSTSKGKNFEETIFQANMEAATELARQLRLRDLGGLIVVDFIDMRNSKHVREVEKQVKAAMKRDKAKVDISRISRFGLMQIS